MQDLQKWAEQSQSSEDYKQLTLETSEAAPQWLAERRVNVCVCVFVCVFVCECMCDSKCKCARGRAGACERCVKMFVALVLLHSVSVWVCAFFLCIYR